MKFPFIILFLSCTLAGCATLSKNECLTGSWLTIGYEDGAEGQPRERIGSHQEACAEYGVTPDFSSYQQGYDNGLLLFCTPRNGFIKGKSGYQYDGICPEKVESGFLQGYDGGREIYEYSQKSSSLNNEMQAIDNRMAALDHRIREEERILFRDEVTRNERRRIYRMIEDLKDEHYDLEIRFQRLLDEKEDVDRRLDFLHRRYRAYQ